VVKERRGKKGGKARQIVERVQKVSGNSRWKKNGESGTSGGSERTKNQAPCKLGGGRMVETKERSVPSKRGINILGA